MPPHPKGPSPKKIALERIEILFAMAYKNRDNLPLANRYVSLAREIAMRQRLRLPREYQHLFCPACHSYFVPGKSYRVRVQHGKVIITCGICGAISRYPLR